MMVSSRASRIRAAFANRRPPSIRPGRLRRPQILRRRFDRTVQRAHKQLELIRILDCIAEHHIDRLKSAEVGSVGVFMAQADCRKLLDNAGVKVNYIYAGEHKISEPRGFSWCARSLG